MLLLGYAKYKCITPLRGDLSACKSGTCQNLQHAHAGYACMCKPGSLLAHASHSLRRSVVSELQCIGSSGCENFTYISNSNPPHKCALRKLGTLSACSALLSTAEILKALSTSWIPDLCRASGR